MTGKVPANSRQQAPLQVNVDKRQGMARCVKFLPVIEHCAAGYGVHEVGRQLSQRAQHKTVFEDVAARHPHWPLVYDQVVVKKQVDVERT